MKEKGKKQRKDGIVITILQGLLLASAAYATSFTNILCPNIFTSCDISGITSFTSLLFSWWQQCWLCQFALFSSPSLFHAISIVVRALPAVFPSPFSSQLTNRLWNTWLVVTGHCTPITTCLPTSPPYSLLHVSLYFAILFSSTVYLHSHLNSPIGRRNTRLVGTVHSTPITWGSTTSCQLPHGTACFTAFSYDSLF